MVLHKNISIFTLAVLCLYAVNVIAQVVPYEGYSEHQVVGNEDCILGGGSDPSPIVKPTYTPIVSSPSHSTITTPAPSPSSIPQGTPSATAVIEPSLPVSPPSSIPSSVGETCTLGEFGTGCIPALTCVLDRLDEIVPIGSCRNLTKSKVSSVRPCTVEHCASVGAAGLCALGIQRVESGPMTCAAWAGRQDGGVKPDCNLKCDTTKCSTVFDNLGKSYCNECALREASCKAGFSEFGPRPRPTFITCGGKPCCSGHGRNCRGLGEVCWAYHNIPGGVPIDPYCAAGSKCVVDSFTKEILSGKCTQFSRVPPCSAARCSLIGSSGLCTASGGYGTVNTSCGKWATRNDGGRKPDCEFTCPAKCNTTPIKDSTGATYCNLCNLVKKSCDTGFSTFG